MAPDDGITYAPPGGSITGDQQEAIPASTMAGMPAPAPEPPTVAPCADCGKQIGLLRAALIILSLAFGVALMAYILDRKFKHGHGHEEASGSASA